LLTTHHKPVPVACERSTGQILNSGHTFKIETEALNAHRLDGLEDPPPAFSTELAQFHEHIHINARPVQRFSR
jgi:carbonic anhydrase